jgi:hypothetical protein
MRYYEIVLGGGEEMKTIFTSISLVFLIGSLSCCQTAISEHSNSKALQCLTSYIEAMNSKQEKQLLSFFMAYYGNSDHSRRLELASSLKKRWGRLVTVRGGPLESRNRVLSFSPSATYDICRP